MDGLGAGHGPAAGFAEQPARSWPCLVGKAGQKQGRSSPEKQLFQLTAAVQVSDSKFQTLCGCGETFVCQVLAQQASKLSFVFLKASGTAAEMLTSAHGSGSQPCSLV